MVKLAKPAAAAAVAQKKAPHNKTNNKDKVAKPAPANRVAVSKAAAAANKVAKTAAAKPAAAKPVAAKPQPKKQAKVEESEEEDDDEEVNEDEEIEAQTAEDHSAKRVPGVSVFVGNIPSNTKRAQLIKLFKPHAKVLRIRFRKPNGGNLFKIKANTLPFLIAFVDVATQEEAEIAAQHLNQAQFKGTTLRVNLNKTVQAPGSEKRSVFVGSLTHATTDQQLIDTFNCCGEIDYVRTLLSDKGCQGAAFVCFKDAASVEMALELNGGELNGRPMSVQKCKPPQNQDDKKKLKSEEKAGKKAKSDKQQFAGAKVAGAKKPKQQGKAKKGGLTGAKLLAKKVAPRPAKVTA